MLDHSFSKKRPASASYLWWLNPIWPLSLMLLGTGIAAYIIPNADYLNNWKTPKYLDAGDLKFIVLSVFGFVASGCFVNFVAKPSPLSFTDNIENNRRIPWPLLWVLFYSSFALIVTAYFLWLVLSMASGLSVSDIVAALHNAPNATDVIHMKTETLPGVTTFTQLEMGMALLGVVLGFKFGFRKNLVNLVLPIMVVLGLVFLRARFREERLAMLEIMVPTSILVLALIKPSTWPGYARALLGVAPFLAPLALYVFFGAAEYSRSWVGTYADKGETSFPWFVFTRLSGYYVTALNNGAAFVHTIGQLDVPYHTLEWFWKFPLVKAIILYRDPPYADPGDEYQSILKEKLNPELNNPSGVFMVELDYGFWGGVMAWCLIGVIAMLLYRSFRKGSLAGLLTYPFFYIGLLESPRILYWCQTRTFPTWMMLLGIGLMGVFAATGDWRKRRRSADMTEPAFPQSPAFMPLRRRRHVRRVL